MSTGTQHRNEIRDTARTFFKRHLELLSSGRVEEWVELFHETGSIEHPFAPGEYVPTITGHADLLNYISVFPKLFSVTFTKPHFHDTVDPSLVIAEFTLVGTGLLTGNPYNQQYISAVYTIDGKIDRYVDFWNPLESISAVGGNLPDCRQSLITLPTSNHYYFRGV